MKVDLSKEDIQLIHAIYNIADYRSWHSTVGDQKADEIRDTWQKSKKHYGIFAMMLDLLKRLEKA